jgi:hypothetical protein
MQMDFRMILQCNYLSNVNHSKRQSREEQAIEANVDQINLINLADGTVLLTN